MSRTVAKLGRAFTGVTAAALVLAAQLAVTQLAFAAPPPTPGFTVTPEVPRVGETVTFTATDVRGRDPVGWDFENDGTIDATGHTVRHAYTTPGTRTVRMRVTRDDQVQEALKQVRVDAPPSASFTVSPTAATAGETVVFDASASSDPDGRIARYDWDFDNDGQFDDASGVIATHSFGAGGVYAVSLRVTDDRGSTDTAASTVTVNGAPAAPAPNRPPAASFTFPVVPPPAGAGSVEARPALMTPFPVVRIVGSSTRSGARIKLLRVRGATRGAKVTVRCRGGGCRRRQQTAEVRTGSVRFRSFERELRAGARIQVYVTQPGKIGKYTSFKIRSRRPPLRRDLCVTEVTAKPTPCPMS